MCAVRRAALRWVEIASGLANKVDPVLGWDIYFGTSDRLDQLQASASAMSAIKARKARWREALARGAAVEERARDPLLARQSQERQRGDRLALGAAARLATSVRMFQSNTLIAPEAQPASRRSFGRWRYPSPPPSPHRPLDHPRSGGTGATWTAGSSCDSALQRWRWRPVECGRPAPPPCASSSRPPSARR